MSLFLLFQSLHCFFFILAYLALLCSFLFPCVLCYLCVLETAFGGLCRGLGGLCHSPMAWDTFNSLLEAESLVGSWAADLFEE
jgi:hypothetical protein